MVVEAIVVFVVVVAGFLKPFDVVGTLLIGHGVVVFGVAVVEFAFGYVP